MYSRLSWNSQFSSFSLQNAEITVVDHYTQLAHLGFFGGDGNVFLDYDED
jgi:hypothetical protein